MSSSLYVHLDVSDFFFFWVKRHLFFTVLKAGQSKIKMLVDQCVVWPHFSTLLSGLSPESPLTVHPRLPWAFSNVHLKCFPASGVTRLCALHSSAHRPSEGPPLLLKDTFAWHWMAPSSWPLLFQVSSHFLYTTFHLLWHTHIYEPTPFFCYNFSMVMGQGDRWIGH